MIRFKVNKKNRTVTIGDVTNSVTIPLSEFACIENEVNNAFYCEEDIMRDLEQRIGHGELPAEAFTNEKYIAAVTERAVEYKEDGGDGEDAIPWGKCMNMAFTEIPYSDFAEKEKTA